MHKACLVGHHSKCSAASRATWSYATCKKQGQIHPPETTAIGTARPFDFCLGTSIPVLTTSTYVQGQEQGRASPGPRPGPARILPDFREDRARQARGISKKQEDRARPGFAVQEDRAPAGLCGF